MKVIQTFPHTTISTTNAAIWLGASSHSIEVLIILWCTGLYVRCIQWQEFCSKITCFT
jgi:hypothetical protein